MNHNPNALEKTTEIDLTTQKMSMESPKTMKIIKITILTVIQDVENLKTVINWVATLHNLSNIQFRTLAIRMIRDVTNQTKITMIIAM